VAIVFCKWEPVSLGVLLSTDVPVVVILDDWDVTFGGIDKELLSRAVRTYRVRDFDSVEQICAIATDIQLRGLHVDRVASFAEFSQFGAGLLGQLLGTEDMTLRLAVRSRDKRAMKTAMQTAGIPCARWLSVPDPDQPPTEAEVVAATGFPAVLKPVSGMGAIATAIVTGPADLDAAIAARELPPMIASPQMMLEEYIKGEEFHADGVWRDGEPWHFTVGQYLTPRLLSGPGVEGSVMLDPAADASLIDAVLRLHQRVNAALGFTSGATHLEFFRTPDGELIASEIATRFGGGPLLDMVLARDGIDLRELWARELLGDKRPEVTASVTRRYVAGINIPPDGPRTITAVPDTARLDADEQVVTYHLNCAIGEDAPGPWTLPMIVAAPGRDELLRAVERVRAEYRIEAGGGDATSALGTDA
jgi:ATP-grasp domain